MQLLFPQTLNYRGLLTQAQSQEFGKGVAGVKSHHSNANCDYHAGYFSESIGASTPFARQWMA
jgi:hypothetical protein